MPHRDEVREARTDATFLLRDLQAGKYRAAERFLILPKYKKATVSEILANRDRIRHMQALEVVAHERGHASWNEFVAAHGNAKAALLRDQYVPRTKTPDVAINAIRQVLLDLGTTYDFLSEYICKCSNPNCPNAALNTFTVDRLLSATRSVIDHPLGLILPQIGLANSIALGEALRPHLIAFGDSFSLLQDAACRSGAPNCPNVDPATMSPTYLVAELSNRLHSKAGCGGHKMTPAFEQQISEQLNQNLSALGILTMLLSETNTEHWSTWLNTVEEQSSSTWHHEAAILVRHGLSIWEERIHSDMRVMLFSAIAGGIFSDSNHQSETCRFAGQIADAVLSYGIADRDLSLELWRPLESFTSLDQLVAEAPAEDPHLFTRPSLWQAHNSKVA